MYWMHTQWNRFVSRNMSSDAPAHHKTNTCTISKSLHRLERTQESPIRMLVYRCSLDISFRKGYWHGPTMTITQPEQHRSDITNQHKWLRTWTMNKHKLHGLRQRSSSLNRTTKVGIINTSTKFLPMINQYVQETLVSCPSAIRHARDWKDEKSSHESPQACRGVLSTCSVITRMSTATPMLCAP